MSLRRPLQPIPALSAHVSSTRYGRITTTSNQGTDGKVDMEDHVQDDVQDSGSVVSGLTSLEGDDEFERQMIQNARDERRLNETLHGRPQPFRKARTHARVGLTLGNLERNEALNSNNHVINNNNNNVPYATGYHANARFAIKSPPSSIGSTHSDPAIHAPSGWGRKGRSSGKWVQSLMRDEHPQAQQTPAPPDDTIVEQHNLSEADAPRRSVEDSPLSHKSFNQGTPPNDHSGQLDLTFDMDECSIIASTPYIPRNTKLDDILERENMARLDGIPDTSREDMRRPPTHTHGAVDTDPHSQQQGSPVRRLHNRTNSWRSLSKSQLELGKENSPVAVYRKSVETVGTVERHVVANAQTQPVRPSSNQREDTHDLLRRLARRSNTPSPKASAPATRPQPTPPTQPHSSSQTTVIDASHSTSEGKQEAANEVSAHETATAPALASQGPQREHRRDTPHDGTTPDVASSAPTSEQVDETPMPVEHTMLDPKTPVVMGGWVDTPGPRTAHKPVELPHPRSQSLEKSSPRKSRSSTRPTAAPTTNQQPVAEVHDAIQPSLPRPQLHSSALRAFVQEARASNDYGDDTIHSLEDLMTPLGDNEAEEDTLQGLALPTSAPRNEAERERQAEIMDLHRLNNHLRTTKTNVRDASRGMSRVRTRMEHIEVEETGEKIPVIVRDHSHEFSLWTWFRSFFWDGRLKTQREARNALLRMWGGVTLLGILLTVSFIWWASEAVACEIFCHPEYANYSPHPFAVDMDAPRRGIVIPTLVYRALFKSWSTPVVSPILSLFSWAWATLWSLVSSTNMVGLSRVSHTMAANGGPAMAAHTQNSWKIQEEAREEDNWDWSMAEDEILRR